MHAELLPSQLGTSLYIMLLFLPIICYAAVLLKFTYYAQEQKLLSDYYAFMYGNSLHVADNLYRLFY